MKFGAGDGWKGSVGPIVWRMKKYYRVKEARDVLHTINRRKGNWIGHVLHRKLSSKIHHWRKDKSDRKTRKKT